MIKFRFWDKDEKYFITEATIVLDKDGSVEGIEYYHTKLGHSVYNDISYYELLQSTGLKDKNGVEIYEGDIVEAVRKHSEPKLIEDRYCKGIITYSHGCYDIKVEPNVFSGLIPENLLTDIDLTIEVIGNIYEHPHLLEGDNE